MAPVPRDGTFEGELQECIERCRDAARPDLLATLLGGLSRILRDDERGVTAMSDEEYARHVVWPVAKRRLSQEDPDGGA